MKKVLNRVLSVLLACILLAGCLPGAVFAEEPDVPAELPLVEEPAPTEVPENEEAPTEAEEMHVAELFATGTELSASEAAAMLRRQKTDGKTIINHHIAELAIKLFAVDKTANSPSYVPSTAGDLHYYRYVDPYTSQITSHYYAPYQNKQNRVGYTDCETCFAFVMDVSNKLLSFHCRDDEYRCESPIRGLKNFTGWDLYNLFAQNGITTGAHIRTMPRPGDTWGHSMLVLSYNSEGIMIYHGNTYSDDQVSVEWCSWDNFVSGLANCGGNGIEYVAMPRMGQYPPNYDYGKYASSMTYYPTGIKVMQTTEPNVVVRTLPETADNVQRTIANKGEDVNVVGYIDTAETSLWYITVDGKFIFGKRLAQKPSYLTITGVTVPGEPLGVGKFYDMNGTVKSNQPIKSIRAYLLRSNSQAELDSADFAPNTSVSGGQYVYNIRGSRLDSGLKFNKLPVGTYTLRIVATDVSGKTVEITTAAFGVGRTVVDTCAAPVIGFPNHATAGKYIQMNWTAGDTLQYTILLDGKVYDTATDTSGALSKWVTEPGHYVVSGYTTKTNCLQSGEQSSSMDLMPAAVPKAVQTVMMESGMQVHLGSDPDAQIYYKLEGRPQMSPYTGAILVTESTKLYAYAKKAGCSDSATATIPVTVAVPGKPVLSRRTAATVADDSTVSLTWAEVEGANGYTLTVSKDKGQPETLPVVGTSAAYTLKGSGEYAFSLHAQNFKGTGAESDTVTVTAKPPVTVTFVNDDAGKTVLSEQVLRYGENAIAPVVPAKRGYTFSGWDKAFVGVTATTTITACYEINKYIVRFYDSDGVTLRDTQTVPFDTQVPVAAARGKLQVPANYTFLDWRVEKADSASGMDYHKVDSDMDLIAVYRWGNLALPIVLNSVTAARNAEATGYNVAVGFRSEPSASHKAKIVVGLKSSEDKLLATQIVTINLAENTENRTENVFVSYDGTYLASKVEVTMVGLDGNDKTGGALSKTVSAVPTVEKKWSEWSLTAPTGKPADQVQQKTQYRYRDNVRSTTQSRTEKLPGWTCIGTSEKWTDWSEYSDAQSVASATKEVETQQVQVSSAYTQYSYYRYHSYNCSKGPNWGHFCTRCATYLYGGTWVKDSTPWLANRANAIGSDYCGHQNVSQYKINGILYYYEETNSVPAVYKTQYRYRDKYNLYSYEKWTDGTSWSDWSDTPCTEVTNSRNVETRTLYRYVTNDTGSIAEDTSGTPRTIAGKLTAENPLVGKIATILVYKEKNTDPTEAQLEYVGQTTFTADNAYTFTFKTKEEPTESTGDFLVALAVEGATNLTMLESATIRAPLPKYTVTFFDAAGTMLSTQQIEKGGSAIPPAAPAVTGYTFIRWDGNTTNIRRDQSVTAQYMPNTYVVAFVDYLSETANLVRFPFGSTITTVTPPERAGYTFKSWEGLGANSQVTGDTVVTASWTPKSYTVKFVNGEGAMVETQQVTYGKSAKLPAALAVPGSKFLGWSNEEPWWAVTHDMSVYSLLTLGETVAVPSASVDSGEYDYDQFVTLNSATEGAKIYYTTDGSLPSRTGESTIGNTSKEYTEPLVCNSSMIVKAIAAKAGMNDSQVLTLEYTRVSSENSDPGPGEIPQPTDKATVEVASSGSTQGRQVDIPVVLTKNDGGFSGFALEVSYNTTALKLTKISRGSLLSSTGAYFAANPDTGTVVWMDSANSIGDGELFKLTFTIRGDAAAGNYAIQIRAKDGNQRNFVRMKGDMETPMDILYNKGILKVSGYISGDLDGDAVVTAADGSLLVRYLVGLETFTEGQFLSADVNGDKSVTVADAIALARKLVGYPVQANALMAAALGLTQGTLTVGSPSAQTGQSKITVPVTITENPGFGGFALDLAYDHAALTLTEIRPGELLTPDTGIFATNRDAGAVAWADSGDIRADGTLFYLEFDLNADKPSAYPISVALRAGEKTNFAASSGAAIEMSMITGKVTVGAETQPVVPPDDGDSGTFPDHGNAGAVSSVPAKPIVQTIYADVASEDWFYRAVQTVTQKGLMAGIPGGSFAPYEKMSRGMLVTVLHRMAGEPAAEASAFCDVTKGWYAAAVHWAVSRKIITGYMDGRFGAEDSVSREQIAVMLYRYMGAPAIDATKVQAFADLNQASDWARDALMWAVSTGLFCGDGANCLRPGDTATRAEVAAVVERLYGLA